MKKIPTLVMLLLLSGSLFALSWTPSASVGTSAVFIHNLTLEDQRLDDRSAMALDVQILPLSMGFSGNRLSLGLRAGWHTDSLAYANTVVLGSRRLELVLDWEKVFSQFLISADLGLGYGLVDHQNIGFAFLSGGVKAGWRFSDFLDFSLGATVVYRREFLETKVTLSLTLVLPENIVGGGK